MIIKNKTIKILLQLVEIYVYIFLVEGIFVHLYCSCFLSLYHSILAIKQRNQYSLTKPNKIKKLIFLSPFHYLVLCPFHSILATISFRNFVTINSYSNSKNLMFNSTDPQPWCFVYTMVSFRYLKEEILLFREYSNPRKI